MLLSDDERRRFSEYLRRDADSSTAIAEQMEKLGGPPGKTLAENERRYAAAANLIADRLDATESMSIGR